MPPTSERKNLLLHNCCCALMPWNKVCVYVLFLFQILILFFVNIYPSFLSLSQAIAVKVLWYCSLFEVGNVGQHAYDAVKFIPNCVWPRIKDSKTKSSKSPEHIRRLNKASVFMSSSVSCIKLFGKHPSCATDGGSIRHALYPAMIKDFDEYFSILLQHM